jgi:hypothetical protein
VIAFRVHKVQQTIHIRELTFRNIIRPMLNDKELTFRNIIRTMLNDKKTSYANQIQYRTVMTYNAHAMKLLTATSSMRRPPLDGPVVFHHSADLAPPSSLSPQCHGLTEHG